MIFAKCVYNEFVFMKTEILRAFVKNMITIRSSFIEKHMCIIFHFIGNNLFMQVDISVNQDSHVVVLASDKESCAPESSLAAMSRPR